MTYFSIDIHALPIALIYFIPALIGLATIIYIRIKFPKAASSIVFQLFIVMGVVWQLSEGFLRMSANYETAMFWHKLLSLTVILSAVFGFHFILLFINNVKAVKSWWFIWLVYVPALVFFFCHLMDIDVWGVDRHSIFNWISDSRFTTFEMIEVIWFSGLSFGSIGQLVKFSLSSQNTNEIITKRARLMLIGFAFPIFFGVFFQLLFPLFFDIQNLPLAAVLIMTVILAALVIIKKYQFLSYNPKLASDKILETMDNSVIIFDHELIVRYVNRAFTKLTDYSKDELLNKNLQQISVGLADKYQLQLNQDSSGEEMETSIINKQGDTRTVVIGFSAYKDKENRTIGTIALLTDITEQELMRKRLEHGKKQALQYQSMLLGSQLNPHFIFNALNSIQFYILEQNVVQALDYVSDFSKLMRTVLQNSLDKWINLNDEIAFLTQYMELELKRFQGKFDFEIKIDESIDPEETYLPPMLIQPYVENAVIHGFNGVESGGKLFVSFEMFDSETIKCTIEDNGVGISKEAMDMTNMKKSLSKHSSQGIGLLKRRLEVLKEIEKSNYSVKLVEIKEKNRSGTIVEVFFPLRII
ncbi:MAG: histidine kinase [Crocinitomicaceae bacterium]